MTLLNKTAFTEQLSKAYQCKSASINIGAGMLNNETIADVKVMLPLKNFTRHGLIAGATGTGKTKTLQMITEQLSLQGVPSLVMDIKGDLSGIAAIGTTNKHIEERCNLLEQTYKPMAFDAEFLSLNDACGVKLRATVSEFGPTLLAKILDLNTTQSSILAVLFKYCDDAQLPLVDLKDFMQVLQYATNQGKQQLEQQYGKLSASSIGIILRKVMDLQQQGGDLLFGEPSFDVQDLMRVNGNGHGIINVLRVVDIQNKPKLFSTFVLSLLAELYATLPEAGDLEKPKLCLFIDEAHLIFKQSEKVLMEEIETTIKLIRSKGIGIFFITQSPTDIPQSVLGQLGLKVQHALRAFTAADRKAIKLAAENFPVSDYYTVDEMLTQLGIGQAFVTGLDEKGIPTPLVATLCAPPQSRMGILTDNELNALVANSKLAAKYNTTIDRQSAFEILQQKIQTAVNPQPLKAEPKTTETKSTLDEILSSPVTKQVAKTAATLLTRGLLGALGISGGKKNKSSWF